MTLPRRGKVTHLTAVVLIPPEDVWEPIQRIRRLHDPNIKRWMPHITLLYPFVPHALVPSAVEQVAAVVSRHSRLSIELAEFSVFNHPGGKVTLWLSPSPPDPIKRLQAALQGDFPQCDEASAYRSGFVPHLSVGVFLRRAEARIARDKVEPEWRPVRFEQTSVSVIARSGYERDPFKVVAEAPLHAP